jgi:DNA-binding MarR family transcriptional regulator
MISSSGMTDGHDRLERAGLVERHPDPKDRRGKVIALRRSDDMLRTRSGSFRR